MKIKVDIDCTPGEARQFLGLPDIKPMQDSVLADMQKRFQTEIENLDPKVIMQNWLAPAAAGFEQFQKAMWQAASQGGGSSDSDKDK